MPDTLKTHRALPPSFSLLLWAALAAAQPALARAADESPAPAAAPEDSGPESEGARAAFERAARLAQEGHIPEALQAMENAAAQDPTPPVLLNLGRLREETGDLAGAAQAYRELLRRTRDPHMRSLAQGRRDAVEKRLKEARGSGLPAAAARCPEPTPCPVCSGGTCPACPVCPAAPVPIYRKPWFWVATIGGALVLAGAAAGVTYALTRPATTTAAAPMGLTQGFSSPLAISPLTGLRW